MQLNKKIYEALNKASKKIFYNSIKK